MKNFYDFIVEKEGEQEHHASVIPLTGFSPISHMGHAKDLGSAMKKLPGKKHVGISSKSDLYSDKERGDILHKQWGDKDLKHHVVKSGGETIAKAYHSLPKNGKKHLHLLVGHDRKEFAHGLKKSLEAGKIKEMGHHKWDSVTIHHPEDTERKHGMSGTNMRNAADKGNLKEFHRHLGKAFTSDEAKHHMEKFKHGISTGQIKVKRPGSSSTVKEDVPLLFKAVFVTGGPGSGKDIIIREAITDSRFVELNSVQAFDYLMDKQKLSEKTNDYRREAIRSRGPLIINGPADDHTRILTIKEELEELGYSTTMVFVNTTNEASKERNERLKKTLAESIRYDKWQLAQASKEPYRQNFTNFIEFNNSSSLEEIEENITDTYEKINTFIENRKFNEIAFSWIENNGKYNITESVFKEDENVKKNFRFFESYKAKRTAGQTSTGHTKISAGTGPRADGPNDITPDNRAGDPNADNIKWDRNAKRGGYTFRTYTEATGTQVQVFPAPKESNFNKDKEKVKKKGMVDSPTVNQRMRNVAGVGQEFDTRQQGTVYPMSGLGDVTYREHVDFRRFRESFNDPADSEMGVGGVLGGSTNKEPMEDPKSKVGYNYTKKKKK